jgi:hypothetical protein
MNGYPKNHDCTERQPKHDEIDRQIAEWRKTHEIEVIPTGAVSAGYGDRESKLQKWTSRLPWLESDED